MKKIFILGLLLLSNVTFATNLYSNSQTVTRFRINNVGMIEFGTHSQPNETCNYYDFYFTFDPSTSKGQAMLSMLLAGKISKIPIEIWYTTSTTPGASLDDGCKASTMAVAYSIGFK